MNKSSEVMESLLDQNASIVFLTEIWSPSQNNTVTANVKSYGFNFCLNVRQDENKNSGGGAGVLCSSRYKLVKIKSPTFESFDCCICTMTSDSYNKVVLISIYKQQHISIQIFFNEFAVLLERYCISNTVNIRRRCEHSFR